MDAIHDETIKLNTSLLDQLNSNASLYSQDYSIFSDDQKQSLGAIVNNTKSLAALISQVIS